MADCAYFEELIGAGLDGELTEAEEAALRAHLETCENCRAFYNALRGISESLRDELPAPPADLTERVMDAVRAQAAPKKAKIVPMPRYARYAALAAAAALVILAGVRFAGPGMRKGASLETAPAEAPMTAMSAPAPAEAAAGDADDVGPAPEARAETAAAGASNAVQESREAEYAPEITDSAEAPPEEQESLLFDMPMASAAMPAAGTEYRLYRGDAAELLASGEDGGELFTLLAVDKPGPAPDRTPDYLLVVAAPDGNEARLALWEEAGAILVRDAEGSGSAALSADRFREVFGLG